MILGSQTLPTWTWSCTNILKKLKCCYDTFNAHTHGKYGCCRRRGKLFVTSQYTKQGFPYVIGKTPKSFPFSAPKDKAVRRRKTRTIKAAVTGFPLFLAELVVFGIGKAEILQYYLKRAGPLLPTEKSTGFPLS